MSIVKFFLSIIAMAVVIFIVYYGKVIFLILYVDIASKSHDTSLYEYSTFRCKDRNFTIAAPALLYHYNFTGNSASANHAYRFTYDVHDGRKEDISVVSTYPIGSKFKFINYYSRSSFSGGSMFNFLIEDEQGLKSLVSEREINKDRCTQDKIAKSTDNYYPLGKGRKVEDRSYLFNKEAKIYDFETDKTYLQNISEQRYKADIKSTLKLKIPNKNYLYFSRKIVEKYMHNIEDNNLSINIEFESQDIFVPTFSLDGKSFSQYSCQDINISDIYSCYKDFPNWLNKPYKQNPYIKISTLDDIKQQLSLLKEDNYIIVAYLPFVHEYDHYHLKVDDYLKAIYSYTQLKKLDSGINTSKNFFIFMGNQRNLNLSRGLNILDNSGKRQQEVFFLDYKLDARLNDFNLWHKYSSAFFDYHGMRKDIYIFHKELLLTLFTSTEGVVDAKKIIKKIEPYKDDFTTIHIIENNQSIFLDTLSLFNITDTNDFKNLIVVSDKSKKKIAALNIANKQIENNITNFIQNFKNKSK